MANSVTSFRINITESHSGDYVGAGEVRVKDSSGAYISLDGATFTASSTYGDWYPSRLKDGSTTYSTNSWSSDGSALPQWIDVAFSAAVDAATVEIINSDTYSSDAIKTGNIVSTHSGGGTTTVSFTRPSQDANATTAHTIPALSIANEVVCLIDPAPVAGDAQTTAHLQRVLSMLGIAPIAGDAQTTAIVPISIQSQLSPVSLQIPQTTAQVTTKVFSRLDPAPVSVPQTFVKTPAYVISSLSPAPITGAPQILVAIEKNITIEEGYTVTSSVTFGQVVANPSINEASQQQESYALQATTTITVDDIRIERDIIAFIHDMAVSEAFTAQSGATIQGLPVFVVNEAHRMTAEATGNLLATYVVDDVCRYTSEVGGIYDISVGYSYAAAQELSAGAFASVSVDERITALDQLIHSAVVTVAVDEAYEATEATAFHATALIAVGELVAMISAVDTANKSFYTYALNTLLGATSRYGNYGFNSFASTDEACYGANDTGLYLLEGDNDNGYTIPAGIRSNKSDLASEDMEGTKHKTVSHAYVGMSSDGDMILQVISSSGSDSETNSYRIDQKGIAAKDTTRVPLGKGVKARYWQFTLSNEAGRDFDIDTIEFLPIPMTRRI